MIKKIGIAVTGLALVGIVSVGLNSSFIQQANHGDVPAPQRPDLAYSEGHTGSISKLEAHGDHGGAPAYDHGRPPIAPSNAHGSGGGTVAKEI
ncbi:MULTISPECIES: Phr family secreted Rap phosphatase inhibitor [unclassified Bacillus cereus group]|uniref:Phr family secreted Rap phosphatase inhibitor n=1 Tax=unclassified Bacillus cereus group TaxID=2750818 RepID=UPI0024CA62AE|nr:MAG: Phr family secreted Rap phosphatase inhibitor [Bacillus paranthracis]WAI32099.1 MAG: Phr family secreted Rap phosphatase inhibitor [Bacillus paranthracis]WAI39752.1 MAG: Phr family secreted Rap phosphatase inhibitor [Bacillus paranthracis]